VHAFIQQLNRIMHLGLAGFMLLSVGDSARPDGQDESDLVDEISKIVDDVQSRDGFIQEAVRESAEEVAKGIDGPANRDDHAHVIKGSLDVLGSIFSVDRASFAGEDLHEDESPASHTTDKPGQSADGTSLTSISKGKHDDGADQQTPEHTAGDSLAAAGRLRRSGQNQVELNHLQRNGDGPIDVTVHDGGIANLDPELTHVEVVNTSDEGNQRAASH